MIVEIKRDKKTGMEMKVVLLNCKDCNYFKPFRDARGYGECQSNHTFDGAFRETDYCSYAKPKKYAT